MAAESHPIAAGAPTVYTIGHSTHLIDGFLALLRAHAIAAVADVRSTPFSRRNPQYNRENLARALRAAGLRYVWLGEELGARPADPACYADGRVSYAAIAATPAFARGLDRVADGAARMRVALMCAEREPLACHRTALVAPHLAARGLAVRHILADGGLEAHEDTLARAGAGAAAQPDLFG